MILSSSKDVSGHQGRDFLGHHQHLVLVVTYFVLQGLLFRGDHLLLVQGLVPQRLLLRDLLDLPIDL